MYEETKMQVKPTGFGVSYLLDLYDCEAGVCDDLELNYRFLEKLVDILIHFLMPK